MSHGRTRFPLRSLLGLSLGFALWLPPAQADHVVPPPLLSTDGYLWFLPPASNAAQQGFIRLVNEGPGTAQVTINGLDAQGHRSPGTASLSLPPGASRQLNSQDLEFGNAGKGLVGSLGDGSGDWSLIVRSSQPLEALAYIRTPDGFLTSMHDRVAGDGQVWNVPMFNPAENPDQVSRLRLVNTETRTVALQVTGTDDSAQSGDSVVTLSLPALASIELTSSDLELGNLGKGLAGSLGNGSGKWRLRVQADGRITAQSLLYDPAGNLTNLSTVADPTEVAAGERVLWFMPRASNTEQQGFIRLVNREAVAGAVAIWGIDDGGQRSPGTVTLNLAAGESRQMNSQDLETGNPAKGLTGSLGTGNGDWRLVVVSELDYDAMALVRTIDGFLTSVHDQVGGDALNRRVPVFNPAENANQVSVLRLVNPGAVQASVSIRGIDETGAPGPGGAVTLSLSPGRAIELSSADLENGNPAKALTGSLGNGQGKWTLDVASDLPLRLMSLLRAPRGFLTNHSTAARGAGGELVPGLPAVQLTKAVVSGQTPFAAGCEGAQAGTNYPNAEVEPYFAVNPLNPLNFVGVWQQDRWSNGSARGQGYATTLDGGTQWTRSAMRFSQCGGGNSGNGGNYQRATDPWVSFGADGVAHQMSLATSGTTNAMLASRSTDGGLSWSNAATLILDGAGFFNDKNAMTADPEDPAFVYATWDRLVNPDNGGPTYFTRTTNGGLGWEPARNIYDPGPTAQTIGNLVVVLPDGRLVLLFTQLNPGPGGSTVATLRVIRSSDRGLTWSAPSLVADLLAIGASDPDNGTPIRDGAILAQMAAGPDGSLHVVWQDARFSGGVRDGIAWSRSLDGGFTWSAPRQVNQAPGVQAFMPSIHVRDDGMIGIAYYDLRSNTPAGTLPTDYWLLRSMDGESWREDRLNGPFDLGFAPNAGGLFVGDYQALDSVGDDFLSFHVMANPNLANRTDVWFVRVSPTPSGALVAGRPVAPAPKATVSPSWRGAVDANIRRMLEQRRREQQAREAGDEP